MREPVDYGSDAYRCTYDHYGDRCMNRGTWKSSTSGSGEWLCLKHAACKSQMEGLAIIEDSKLKNGPNSDQNKGGNL